MCADFRSIGANGYAELDFRSLWPQSPGSPADLGVESRMVSAKISLRSVLAGGKAQARACRPGERAPTVSAGGIRAGALALLEQAAPTGRGRLRIDRGRVIDAQVPHVRDARRGRSLVSWSRRHSW